MSYIDRLIKEQLNGNESRVAELFVDESIFPELIANGSDGDWYHFERKTFDGQYFVKTNSGFACYQQDRGAVSDSMEFNDIHQAAIHFFTKAGYIKSTKCSHKKWWAFWQ